MRDLINIVSEEIGDSDLPLDDLAAKYVGPDYSWSDTHYKNILYNVRPLSEMFKLAVRLDGGEIVNNGVLAEMLDDLYSRGVTSQFTEKMESILDSDAEDALSGGTGINIKQALEYDPRTDEGYGYWVYSGPDFEILIHVAGMGPSEYWYTGNQNSVIRFLKKWQETHGYHDDDQENN
jgi:hypothetical protein